MVSPIGMRIPPHIGKLGMEKIADWAASVGLNVIDVPFYNKEIKTALNNAGLEVGSVDLKNTSALLSEDESRRADAINSISAQMSEVAELGGKVLFMVLLPEDINQSREKSFSIWKETFPEVVSQAEKNGLYMALEGWPGPGPQYPALGCTPETLRAMFNHIPSKHFGMNYDPSHLVRLGIDHLRVLAEFGDRVNYCHGKDTEILEDELYEYGTLPATFGVTYDFSEGAWRYTIPGHGEVKWDKVAVRLDKLGYKGPISIELEDHRFWGSLEAEQRGIIKAKDHLALYFK
ncbi:sugar phosphate isomerase/epimerase family protein [Lederbergia wuyishanensis]|uniref:Sugar phosphate isomerase/epimerase n=1 Tax=Lederbergia wuyishanensis TaxID=1347903 RepID=A0ABU0D9I4_9BACI|nr:sugar phosphate isomerase/epimerase family protein [Lederbergia wuyishanensis]MCJ8007479.1 sugar phosphate isomerase/epimerase [Lederbergia wuyishanensis]MDQ0345082.1 sugar phosphate isomerase/epimerase [Lederbergia wuyishanensis]